MPNQPNRVNEVFLNLNEQAKKKCFYTPKIVHADIDRYCTVTMHTRCCSCCDRFYCICMYLSSESVLHNVWTIIAFILARYLNVKHVEKAHSNTCLAALLCLLNRETRSFKCTPKWDFFSAVVLWTRRKEWKRERDGAREKWFTKKMVHQTSQSLGLLQYTKIGIEIYKACAIPNGMQMFVVKLHSHRLINYNRYNLFFSFSLHRSFSFCSAPQSNRVSFSLFTTIAYSTSCNKRKSIQTQAHMHQTKWIEWR